MNASAPHYLLFSESRAKRTQTRSHVLDDSHIGEWRFVLETVDGSARFEAADEEPNAELERLELLAVVRGLEALNQPSRVTLLTASRYVSRGFRFGLNEWRENGWQWERYGEMAPVKNADLWRRVDRAMQFHRVECRIWRFDPAETNPRVRSPAMRMHSPRRQQTKMSRTSQATSPRRSRFTESCAGLCRDMLQRLRPNSRTALDTQTA